VEKILVAGLGNPGDEYAGTRHNIGFRVADELCGRIGGRLVSSGGEYLIARAIVNPVSMVVLKPLTYMNNSGAAIAEAMAEENVPLERMIVVVDDFALPLGRLRIRGKGSDGGHNGLTSVLHALGTDCFTRLRCGIGRDPMPPKSSMHTFVLSSFERDELQEAEQMIVRAADAVLEFARAGLASAMNRYNT
jgi:peptidyl-tRNA hydrolase, PTH1 family